MQTAPPGGFSLLQKMPLSLTPPGYNFAQVIPQLTASKNVAIVTWSFDPDTQLHDTLRQLPENSKLTIITNVPDRFPTYYNNRVRERARSQIRSYIERLAPTTYRCAADTWFCFNNHAKIIICDTIAYVGSANFTHPSQNNFEAGYITAEATEISQLVQLLERIKSESIAYFDVQTSPELQQIFLFALEVPALLSTIEDQNFEVKMNYHTDDYELHFTIDSFSIPEAVKKAVESLQEAWKQLASKQQEGIASPAESRFPLQELNGECTMLFQNLDRLNSIPGPIDENTLGSKLLEQYSHLSSDGNPDDVISSSEYQEAFSEAVERDRTDRETTASKHISSLMHILRNLRIRLLRGLAVNPSLDNTQTPSE
jgi:hypothetical protein